MISFLRGLGCAAATLALTACLDGSSTSSSNLNLALVSVNAQYDSSHHSVATVDASLFQVPSYSVPSSTVTADTCIQQAITPPSTGPAGTELNGGSALQLTIGDSSYTLVHPTGTLASHYALAGGSTVIPDAGTLSLAVPGASGGFPALSAGGSLLAEAFVLQPVALGTAGNALPIHWSPTPTAPGSGILLNFRYTPAGGTQSEIECLLVDDGAFGMPATFADAFRAGGSRTAQLTRVRSSVSHAAAGSASNAVLFYSTFTSTAAVGP